MSQENVEVVRRQFEAFSAGDLDAWARLFHHDVVVIAPEGWPEGAEFRGLAEWRGQFERFRDSWADARVEIEEVRALGTDQVVTRYRYVTRGSDPGMSFDTPMAALFVVQGGLITRGEYFWDFADALEAAGLSE